MCLAAFMQARQVHGLQLAGPDRCHADKCYASSALRCYRINHDIVFHDCCMTTWFKVTPFKMSIGLASLEPS